MTPESYSGTAEMLVDRIVALIPENQHILSMTSAWDLFKVDGFKCDDIGPSLFQAQFALQKAKTVYNTGINCDPGNSSQNA